MEPSRPPPAETVAQSPAEQTRAATASGIVTVPGFDIEAELGRGGMGVVYRARQTGLNRTVALKMVIAGPFADPTTRARFLVEAEAVAALEHAHVVRVFAFGEHLGFPYLAMEFLPGGTLADRIKKDGPFPARQAAELLVKLAGAVAHAHARGIIHRDIKPLNILLTAAGEPRLTDFGLAKVGRSELTVTGAILGTPSYMSPEQAAGKVRELGPPTDIYALGAVLYELLTGQPPFTGVTATDVLQKVLTTEPERPRTLNPNIPHDLERICLKCLEKSPAKRYRTARGLLTDLTRLLSDKRSDTSPTPTTKTQSIWVKRNKAVSATIALFAFAFAGIVLFARLPDGQQEPNKPPSNPETTQSPPNTPVPDGPVPGAGNKIFTPAQAREREGEELTVEFVVRSIGGNSNLYLNSEERFTSIDNFCVRITSDYFKAAGADAKALFEQTKKSFEGKTVRVRGTVARDNLDNKALLIEVRSPKQIIVVPDP